MKDIQSNKTLIDFSQYKIAIVHDELIRRGGAEQVTLIMHEAFPEAPIYTTCYNPKQTYEEFKNCTIQTSWLNLFIHNEKNIKRFFFPFSFWAMRQLDLSDYNIIVISSTTYGKFIRPPKNALVINFCHYPFRLAWFGKSYPQILNSKGLKRSAYKWVTKTLRKMDYKAAKRTDWFITNTPKIRNLIQQCYQPKNPIEVIPASIICDNFKVTSSPKADYYLVVSRLEPYKMVDLTIRAFNQMPNKKLIIVGKGSQKSFCKKIAHTNIEFKEGISTEELSNLYSNCKAMVFPQKEDYGLTPIEANASGRPVIAYGKGGVTYTTIPFNRNSKECTAVYFNKQNEKSLIEAVELCDQLEFDPLFIRKHAEKFDQKVFIKNLKSYIASKISANN